MPTRKYIVRKDSLGFYVLWAEYLVDGTFEPMCKRGLMSDIWERAYTFIENDAEHGINATLTFDLRGVGSDGIPTVEVV